MPTVNFSLEDLNKLVGKKLTLKQVEELLVYAKGEVNSYNEKTDEVSASFEDTNLPYLWSVEGIARLIRTSTGKEKGFSALKPKEGGYKLVVDKSVKAVRPYIGAFVAKGHKIDDYLIKQMIQLQEKLCESYGRRREKAAVGVYSYDKIKFPVHYKATDPESVEFIPLDYKRKMTQQEILEDHPKGKEYAWILKDAKKYPLLIDDKDNVLSFPPIINSIESGKINIGDEHLFIEVTGTDNEAVNLAVNIFAYAFSDRGFDIYSVSVKYPDETIKTPCPFSQTVKITNEQIKSLLGLELSDKQAKELAEKAGFNFNNYTIEVPDYRKDIMHAVDVIEDIGIQYGYDNIEEQGLSKYTAGETTAQVKMNDRVRDIISGLGFQEIMSPILTNKTTLFKNMNLKEAGAVEIEDPISDSYSAVRNSLLPILMEVLSKNKHSEYPQKVFEQGLVTLNKKTDVEDHELVSALIAAKDADFTKIRQIIDCVMKGLGIEYEVKDTEHDSFIPGRVGKIVVKGKDVAVIGEIHPSVIVSWGLDVPVAAAELDLGLLLETIKKE
jgi:phenylalanyl-tRNA synthetase beta chain